MLCVVHSDKGQASRFLQGTGPAILRWPCWRGELQCNWWSCETAHQPSYETTDPWQSSWVSPELQYPATTTLSCVQCQHFPGENISKTQMLLPQAWIILTSHCLWYHHNKLHSSAMCNEIFNRNCFSSVAVVISVELWLLYWDTCSSHFWNYVKFLMLLFKFHILYNCGWCKKMIFIGE
jgi:hypothetical protein